MATPIVSVKGLDNITTHFSKQKNPLWRVFLSEDARSVVATNFDVPDFNKSFELLKDVLNNISQENIYTLETFKTNSERRYIKPDTSVNFLLGELAPAAVGNIREPAAKAYDAQSLKNQIDLIHENAKLISEIGIIKFQKEHLEKEILELNSRIVDLETELDALEDEDEDDEDEKIGGESVGAVLAGLLKEHGADVVAHLIPKKESDLNPEVKINGVGDSKDKSRDYTLEQLLTALDKVDTNLHYHLYKLVLISQQKPDKFKFMLNLLDKE